MTVLHPQPASWPVGRSRNGCVDLEHRPEHGDRNLNDWDLNDAGGRPP